MNHLLQNNFLPLLRRGVESSSTIISGEASNISSSDIRLFKILFCTLVVSVDLSWDVLAFPRLDIPGNDVVIEVLDGSGCCEGTCVMF